MKGMWKWGITSLFFGAVVGHVMFSQPLDVRDRLDAWPMVEPAPPKASVNLSWVDTAGYSSAELMVYRGGHPFKMSEIVYSGFVITHNSTKETILFDVGVNRNLAQQLQEAPAWLKAFQVVPVRGTVREALDKKGLKPSRILLSHFHYDHVGALKDFPGVEAWAPKEEWEHYLAPGLSPREGYPVQYTGDDVVQKNITYTDTPYLTFEKSWDVFGDGSAVAVPLPGHTPGSQGLFVHTPERTYFLVGDLVWNRKALQDEKGPREKHVIPSNLFESSPLQLKDALIRTWVLGKKHPEIVIVPSHDREVLKDIPQL